MSASHNEKPAPQTTTSIDAVEDAIDKLKGKDRIGHLGQLVATIGGGGAGAAAAGAVAGAAGAATLLGSSTLGTVLGGVFVTATPVGWVIGCAGVAAVTAYGITRLIRSAGRNDRIREEIADSLTKRLEKLTLAEQSRTATLAQLQLVLSNAIRDGHITPEQAIRMVVLVESNKLDEGLAIARIQALYK